MPGPISSLIQQCWAHDPAERPSFRAALTRLESFLRQLMATDATAAAISDTVAGSSADAHSHRAVHSSRFRRVTVSAANTLAETPDVSEAVPTAPPLARTGTDPPPTVAKVVASVGVADLGQTATDDYLTQRATTPAMAGPSLETQPAAALRAVAGLLHGCPRGELGSDDAQSPLLKDNAL